MARRVAVAGVGVTKHVAYHVESTWKDLVVAASLDALDDCGLTPSDVQGGVVAYLGEATIETGNIGPLVADAVGIAPAGVTGISTACSGGLVALHHGYALVAAGLCDVVLVAGFEKGSELYEYVETICPSSETEYDYTFGLTHLDWLALISKRYIQKYGLDREAMITWIEDRHWFARRHPHAMYYGQPMLSRDELGSSPVHMAGGRADGAAAVVLTTDERARGLRRRPALVEGLGYASASAYLPHKFHHARQFPESDIADGDLTKVAADHAYRMAGLTDVRTVDLFEINDAVPVLAFMELEALGLHASGTAWKAVMAGDHGLKGRFPTNTHGGSSAFGHASGAIGLVNVVEAVTQMRGRAGARQLDRPVNLCVCQAAGGSCSNNAVVVLKAG